MDVYPLWAYKITGEFSKVQKKKMTQDGSKKQSGCINCPYASLQGGEGPNRVVYCSEAEQSLYILPAPWKCWPRHLVSVKTDIEFVIGQCQS